MEGRNREVRRLWESQDVKVSRLKRVRFGNIFIPSHVRTGQWLELDSTAIKGLCATAGVDSPKSQEPMTREEKEKHQRQLRKLRAGKGRSRVRTNVREKK
jgi:23S rRNA pseudouridine2605 synthase